MLSYFLVQTVCEAAARYTGLSRSHRPQLTPDESTSAWPEFKKGPQNLEYVLESRGTRMLHTGQTIPNIPLMEQGKLTTSTSQQPKQYTAPCTSCLKRTKHRKNHNKTQPCWRKTCTSMCTVYQRGASCVGTSSNPNDNFSTNVKFSPAPQQRPTAKDDPLPPRNSRRRRIKQNEDLAGDGWFQTCACFSGAPNSLLRMDPGENQTQSCSTRSPLFLDRPPSTSPLQQPRQDS